MRYTQVQTCKKTPLYIYPPPAEARDTPFIS
jgi:hypothetical protein